MLDVTYYNLHIPKTSGTSMSIALRNIFQRESFCPINSMVDTREMDLKSYRYYTGHFGWYMHEKLPPPVRIITMLRHPVAQFASACWHMTQMPNEFSAMLNGLDLSELLQVCLDDRHIAWFLKNLQTRHLTCRAIDNHRSQMARAWAPFAESGDNLDVDLALDHLTQCWYFGFQEQHSRALREISSLIGDDVKQIREVNGDGYQVRRPSLHSVPQEIIRRIERFLVIDLELYRRAKEIYESRWGK